MPIRKDGSYFEIPRKCEAEKDRPDFQRKEIDETIDVKTKM